MFKILKQKSHFGLSLIIILLAGTGLSLLAQVAQEELAAQDDYAYNSVLEVKHRYPVRTRGLYEAAAVQAPEVLGESATASGRPPVNNTIVVKTESINLAQLQQLMDARIAEWLAFGRLKGDKGEKGDTGLVTNPVTNQSTAVVGGYPIVTYVPPVPAQNFAGTSLAGFGNLSADIFSASDKATINNLSVTGPAVFSNNAALATSTISSLTVAGETVLSGSTTIANLTVSGLNPGLTAGSIAFQGAGGLEEDNANFYYDAANHRLGIGTSTPGALLSLAGSAISSDPLFDVASSTGTSLFRVANDGSVTVNDTKAVAPAYGSELVTAGNWTNTGWTGSFPSFTHTPGNTNTLTVNLPEAVAGKKYSIVYSISGTGGSVSPYFGSSYLQTFYAGYYNNGVQIGNLQSGIYTLSGPTTFTFVPTSDFDGTVSYVSVKEVLPTPAAFTVKGSGDTDGPSFGPAIPTDSGWTSAGWTGSYPAFTHTAGNTSPLSVSVPDLIPGRVYRIGFAVSGVTSGLTTLAFGDDTLDTWISYNYDSFKYGDKLSGSPVITFTPTSDFNGTISDVIIQEMYPAAPLVDVQDSTGKSLLSIQGSTNYQDWTSMFIGSGGKYALNADQNIGIGLHALDYLTTGWSNVAVGNKSLWSNTTGGDNSAFGEGVLVYNTTGNENVSVGSASMEDNITGSYNIAMGNGALSKNLSGNENTALGGYALWANKSDKNTAVGSQALNLNTTGTLNTAIGYNAGLDANFDFGNTTGSHNTFIGALTHTVDTTQVNYMTVIGADAVGKCSNCIVLGRVTDSVVIGTTTASSASLTVQGSGSPCWLLPLPALPCSLCCRMGMWGWGQLRLLRSWILIPGQVRLLMLASLIQICKMELL
ncbi:MAG: hypothetical protein M1383_00635 [Patescibacteria group bacterium]|nr:hypothetical protein [Patescibacteria group bacterium]